MDINTRFAPSPTGELHIGGARTAILSYIVAKKLSGNFLLRIEDTDTLRSTEEYASSILESLKWLGINFANKPIYQSDRYSHYKNIAEELVKNDLAYYCYSTVEELDAKRKEFESTNKGGWKYDRFWRDNKESPPVGVKPSIRLKVPNDGQVVWNDFIKGQITISNSQLDDFIIVRSDGTPTYNFCVAIDDSDMNISHVIRGEDHIGNTPKQIHIYHALGKTVPVFGHVPLILNADGSKMSKRDKGASVNYYKELGILPDALINYLLLMSSNNITEEIVGINDFIKGFELNNLGNSPVKFDMDKLAWINQQYLKNMSKDDFLNHLKTQLNINDFEYLKGRDVSLIMPGILERSKYINDFNDLIQPLINWNKSGLNDSLISSAVKSLISKDLFNPESIHEDLKLWTIENDMKFGDLMKPMRNILFPNMKLPIHEALAFIGKSELEEILNNVKKLKIT